jgi:hypothetical protein
MHYVPRITYVLRHDFGYFCPILAPDTIAVIQLVHLPSSCVPL